jgi:recombination protein RecT
LNSLTEIKHILINSRDNIQQNLGGTVSADKFISIAISAISCCPDILKADKKNILNVIMQCARDGLLPDNREASLISYKGNIKYTPMYQGIIKKMYESGFTYITANVVYSNDYFVQLSGDSEAIEHKPAPLNQERGELVGVYAIAKNRETVYREVMRLDEINKIRETVKYNKIWNDFFDEMAKKTAIRRLAKMIPTSIELASVIQSDNLVELEPVVEDMPVNTTIEADSGLLGRMEKQQK